MAAGQNKDQADGVDKGKLTTVLVPVAGVALIVILVVVVAATSDSPTKSTEKGGKGTASTTRPRREKPADLTKLSDGTATGADDPELKPIGDRGLKYRDLKVGDGEEVRHGARVTVDYTGWLPNKTQFFDSSWKNPEPTSFGLDQVVKGWGEGIPGMKVGGIRKLVIPPELGYAERGAGKDIPPNATLVFEVEVLGVNQ
ncbi:MAG: putative FKBP-type peptidyl-prolyl cis-trans isomerase [Gemmataceae bacterium]|nr:putative FKBP-type peptidyl-prolyl cis-trans isomerase [Gemmataceae bacterium]